MSGSPFSLTVSPLRSPATEGKPQHVTITNNGTEAINVKTSVLILHSVGKGCGFTNGNTGIKVTPVAFTLQPHHVKITEVRVPKSIPKGDYAVIYSGTVQSGHGTSHVSGAVGSQFITSGTASCVHTRLVPSQAASKPASATFPVLSVVLLMVALVAIVSGVTFGLRHHRPQRRY